MTILCSVSDDRQGRKGGMYEATQKKMDKIITESKMGISFHFDVRIRDLQTSRFWEENKVMLNNVDAAINGRLYKVYVIQQALAMVKNGDYVIYNDCSPEIWRMDGDWRVSAKEFDLSVIQRLCRQGRDFLVAFVKWAPENFNDTPLGIHTHHYFTLEPCIRKMDAEKFRHSFQCASGMICIRKTDLTVQLVEEWLFWNRKPVCASLGWPDVPGDESFWVEKEEFKLGHRSDQSILSVLLNKRDWKYVDIVYNEMSPYNFLNFCRKGEKYTFIGSNIKI